MSALLPRGLRLVWNILQLECWYTAERVVVLVVVLI